MTSMKKATEKIVTKNHDVLVGRIDKLSERLTLNETYEDKKERAVTMQINRLSDQHSRFRTEVVDMIDQISHKLDKALKKKKGEGDKDKKEKQEPGVHE